VTLELWQSGSKIYGPLTINSPSGHFEFTGVCNGTYDVRASIGVSTDGAVNTTDAGQTNSWGAHPYEIEKVRFYAGDVTGSAFFINGTDAQHIQNYFVNGTGLDKGSWAFWKVGETISSNTYPTAAYPSVTVGTSDVPVNFYALCAGDFNRSFDPSLTKAASSTLDLAYGDTRQLEANQEFELPIKIINETSVGAVSLILNFPAELVEVEDVLMNNAGGSLDWAVFGDELRIGWNSQNPLYLSANAELLTLKLKTTGAFTVGNSIRFRLAADPLNELADEMYNVIGNAVLSIDVIDATTLGIPEQPAMESLQLANHPNPFYGYTNITYTLPFEGKVNLDICSSMGNRVETLVDARQLPGDYTVKFDTYKLAPGVYTATLRLMAHGDVRARTIKIVRAW
jgi:hypothetical protein